MIAFEHYSSGDLYGIRYRFSEVGDALPTHEHDTEMLHNIVVLSGSVLFRCGEQRQPLSPGDVFDFDGTRLHTIECLEAGSEILNLYLYGAPHGYATLAASELKGVIAK